MFIILVCLFWGGKYVYLHSFTKSTHLRGTFNMVVFKYLVYFDVTLCCLSPHPYIFFNQDRVTITFVGFMIQMCGQYGNLIDPTTQNILEKSIISESLYEGLKLNQVDFQDNCRLWTKPIMIRKLAAVLGIEFPNDPEPTYVLTVDNVIKILAIQMRFRSV